MMDGYGGHGWGMGWWWLIGIAIIVVIVWFVVRTNSQRKIASGDTGKTALDVLNERFAKGEIGRDEYEKRKKDLTE